MIEHPVVVMGVAGCGKSSLGVAIAEAEGAQLIEGDAHHSDANPAGWLDTLAGELRARGANTVLTCSALKRAYRDRLRAVVPELRFVFMEIDPASAATALNLRSDIGADALPAVMAG